MGTSNTFISAYDAAINGLHGSGLLKQVAIQSSDTAKRRVVFAVFYAEDCVVRYSRFSGDFSQVPLPGFKLRNDFFKHVYLCHDGILRHICLNCQGLFAYSV